MSPISLSLLPLIVRARQGCYSQEGDIVVLCAYLGQLAKLRDALASEVAVVIDDRDGQELADREAENVDDDSIVERVKVSRRVSMIQELTYGADTSLGSS